MEILLITDTYLSCVPFGGIVIKTNNSGARRGESKQDQSKQSSQGRVPRFLSRAWPWAAWPH